MYYQSGLIKLVYKMDSALVSAIRQRNYQLLMQIALGIFHLPPIISKQKKTLHYFNHFDNNVVTPLMESAHHKRAQCGERREKQPRFSPCTVPLLLHRPRLLAICHCVYTHQPSNCNLRNISYRRAGSSTLNCNSESV